MKIPDYINMLAAAEEKIGGAPEKGFLDLDSVRDSIQKTRIYLEQIAAQFELGLKLRDDVVASLKSKINALKTARYGQLFGPVENILDCEKLDFEQIKSLQTEIDKSLAKCFGVLKAPTDKSNPTNVSDYR